MNQYFVIRAYYFNRFDENVFMAIWISVVRHVSENNFVSPHILGIVRIHLHGHTTYTATFVFMVGTS